MPVLPTADEARRWLDLAADASVGLAVTIDGNDLPAVIDVSFGTRIAPDRRTSVPVDARPRLTPITIVRRATGDTEPFEWANQPFVESEKHGVISFFDPSMEATLWKTVEWKGVCTGYREWVPDVNLHRNAPQLEILQFSARIITLGDSAPAEWRAGGSWPTDS